MIVVDRQEGTKGAADPPKPHRVLFRESKLDMPTEQCWTFERADTANTRTVSHNLIDWHKRTDFGSAGNEHNLNEMVMKSYTACTLHN